MPSFILPTVVGLLPVVLFLSALIYLDSYKLVRFRTVMATVISGGVIAGLSYALYVLMNAHLSVGFPTYPRYVAPPVEEALKTLMVVYLLRRNKLGFLVDATIFGFAIGTGFAVVENAYYVTVLPDAHLAVWIIRGFGTALMHGATTAMVGVIAKALSERRSSASFTNVLPGLAIAVVVHSAFNHFFLSPVLSAVGVLLALPPLMVVVFRKSEESVREWLDVGFDADTELLELIGSGELSESPVGRYLASLKSRFRGEVVADMLCYLRIHVELSLRAKGVLMMREAGFPVEPDPRTRSALEELKYLERSIGKTGRLAMTPFLHVSGKDLWKLYVLPES